MLQVRISQGASIQEGRVLPWILERSTEKAGMWQIWRVVVQFYTKTTQTKLD